MKLRIKYALLLLFSITLFACNTQSISKEIPSKTSSNYSDSTKVKTDSLSNFQDSCNWDAVLPNTAVSNLAKAIYYHRNWNLKNDNEALAILDSLNAKNKFSRAFYFKVVTLMYEKSDGYFSESLGLMGKDFVENHTKEFASYFEMKNCFNEHDLNTWVKIVMLEFRILQDDIETTREEHLLYGYCRKLINSSKNFPKGQKKTIEQFANQLEIEWAEFLKHI